MPEQTTPESPHAEIAKQLLHLRSKVASPRVSPDGRQVASVVSTIDLDENVTRARVWLDDAPLTAGPFDAQPVWSPDAKWLAFTSRRGEKKGDSTLHVMPIGGPGEVRTVCTMPDGLTDVAWSPDGKWLAFTSRTQDPRYTAKDVSWQAPRKIERFFSRLNGEDWIFDRPNHVYVVAADGTGVPRNLTPGEFHHRGVSWLPDSSGVVTVASRHDTWDTDLAVDLYRIPLDGDIVALTDLTGNALFATVSPDGSQVAYLGNDDALTYPQNVRVGVVGIDGSARRWISEAFDRSFLPTAGVRPPVWLDNERVIATAEDRGDTHLYELHVDGRTPLNLSTGTWSVADYDFAAGTLATARTTVARPAELFVDRGDGEIQITHVAVERLGWEKFAAPCTDGSDEVDAWIMRPAGFDPDTTYPVLLNVHGGPFTQYGEMFFDEAQMQAAAGFVVIMSNPRGASGRHTSWGQAIMGPMHPAAPGTGWGSVDVDDVLAVLDTALDRFTFCDRDRVGMLGGSYGGYMATMLAARYGDRFRGICSERSVNNLLTEEYTSDIGTVFRSELGCNPVDHPQEYLRMSPSVLAHQITVPMLIIHSEEDWRCPIGQAEELWVTLRLKGRDATFYRFPGENHELSRSGSPVHRKQRAEIILDWFSERLGK